MAEILRPRPGEEAYDYACGSFGLLIKLQLVGKRLDPLSKVPLRLYGKELTGSSYAIACMNRILHDMQGEVLSGDSMRNPKYRDGNALKRSRTEEHTSELQSLLGTSYSVFCLNKQKTK